MKSRSSKLVYPIRSMELSAACLSLVIGASSVHAQVSTATSVGNFQVQAGSVSLGAGSGGKQVVINLSDSKSVLQWDKLNVPIGATLQFSQPNAQSVVLNRVMSVDPARIDGVMNSNGQVWLLSGSGVLFGKDSKVNVQGLLASSRDISNADFLAGQYILSGGGTGKVSNLGELTVADGGYVLLVGSEVDNQGRIQAQLGQVKLASGKAFVLDLNGDKLLRFDVTEALNGVDGQISKVSNAGQILADGGSIHMTARAANGLVAQVVNTGGLLQANSARWVNGDIVLDAGPGGEVVAGGQLSAQGLVAGSTGGNVTVVGDKITLPSDSRINASGQAGGGNVLVGGDWQGSGSLQQASRVDMKAGADIQANATNAGDGGKVVLWSDVRKDGGETRVAGNIQAQGASAFGNGGRVETSGHEVLIDKSASVNAGSEKGRAGEWLLDPVNVTVDAATAGVIENALASSNVMLTTTGSNINSGFFQDVRGVESGSAGNISVNAPISWSNTILSLHANGNIVINANLSYLAGANGGLDLRAGYANPGVIVSNPSDYDLTKSLQFGMNGAGFLGKATFNGGVGHFRLNDKDYTLINNLSGFQSINTNATTLAGRYALSGDLDASGFNSPIGGASPYFTGTFLGLGNQIKNLNINNLGSNIGLFAINTGLISGVGIETGSVVGGPHNVGALVGINYGGTVRNSYSKVAVIGQYDVVGGLVGLNQSTSTAAVIENSFSSGSVSGTNNMGGLVGVNQADGTADSIVRASYATGAVNGAANGVGIYIGGLVGVNNGTTSYARVQNSYAQGNVFTSVGITGGLVGINSSAQSIVSDAYATGNVTNTSVNFNTSGIGGLVGLNQGAIARSYATGNAVSSQNTAGEGTGGLVGTNGLPGSINDSFATGTATSQVNAGNLIGLNNGTAAGSAALSASNKFKSSSYSNFDFSNVWVLYEGSTAPLLRSFLTPMTVTVGSPTVTSKTYDATNSFAGTGTVSYLSPYANPVAQVSGSVSYSLLNKNVGSQQIQVGGLYSNQQGYLIAYTNNMGAATVVPADLNVVGVSAQSKIYDGATTATLTGTASVVPLGADLVALAGTGVASFSDKNVGTGKSVLVSGYTLTGADASNYNVIQPTGLAANIELAPVANQTSVQSAQIAMTSSSSVLTQLDSASSSISLPSTTTTKLSSNVTAVSSGTSPSSIASPTVTLAAASTTSTTVPVNGGANSSETSVISISNQPAELANLNASNAVAAAAQTTTANGLAATAVPKPQVTLVSMAALNATATSAVGAPTIAAIQTPKAPEDQRDPVLAAVGSFKPPSVLASAGRTSSAKGRDAQVVVPLVQGVLSLETAPPKAASQTVDEQRLSGTGNRSRW